MSLPRIVYIVLVAVFTFSCQTTMTATDALVGPKGAVEKRQLQSRPIEVGNDKILIQTIVATLQDFGFEIKESNVEAGLVSGFKSQTNGMFYGHKSDVRVTVTASKVQKKTSIIRVNFQKVIPSYDPRLYRNQPIYDKNLYQTFFNNLEQSLFLMRHE
jgi:hypothetical protein